MIIENIRDFNLTHIFECGQVFRWDRLAPEKYVISCGNRAAVLCYEAPGTGGAGAAGVAEAAESGALGVLEIEEIGANADGATTTCAGTEHGIAPDGATTTCAGTEHGIAPDGAYVCAGPDDRAFWRSYLDLDRDYGNIKDALGRGDSVMAPAIEYGSGIRILNQDPWETLISFIVSQNNNIPRIRGCLDTLCREYGSRLGVYAGKDYYSFPTMETLAEIEASDLCACRLGYRDRYIVETSREILKDGGKSLYSLAEDGVPYKEAFEYLTSLSGVGPKVANCICLFGLGKTGSFPIDVWMRRTMSRLYGFAEKDVKQMAAYAEEHFGQLGGFAQQYLFYYASSGMLEEK